MFIIFLIFRISFRQTCYGTTVVQFESRSGKGTWNTLTRSTLFFWRLKKTNIPSNPLSNDVRLDRPMDIGPKVTQSATKKVH